MKLHIKCKHYSSRGEQMELQVNMEDMFAMLDEVKPSVLAQYICQRMKPAKKMGISLVDVLAEDNAEGGVL